ncbi:MAG: hypothetical protein H0V56_06895 [Chthoniobacterales bacterium]|nr:hypothetical protein [Chthoniobacterales bacterium]
MKITPCSFRALLICLSAALPFFPSALTAEKEKPAQEEHLSPFGLVYGPKGAFSIKAPEGWVIDNSSGLEQRLPCVLYRKGDTWETAEPLMYAKIAGTDATDHEAFAKKAIDEMTRERGDLRPKRIATGKTAGGEPYFVNEYLPTKAYPRSERVAYIQLPKAVAYVVFSADEKSTLKKHGSALTQVLESFRAMSAKIDEEKAK